MASRPCPSVSSPAIVLRPDWTGSNTAPDVSAAAATTPPKAVPAKDVVPETTLVPVSSPDFSTF
jgi:hypothetical protein